MAVGLLQDSMSIEPYISALLQLPDELKKELIKRLTSSLKKENKENVVTTLDEFPHFQGDWGEGMSVNDYCDELRGNVSPRTVESW
jgi:hypothetical protein